MFFAAVALSPFDVIVIVVELPIWVSSGRSGKGDRDIGFSDVLVNDIVTVWAVVVDG